MIHTAQLKSPNMNATLHPEVQEYFTQAIVLQVADGSAQVRLLCFDTHVTIELPVKNLGMNNVREGLRLKFYRDAENKIRVAEDPGYPN